MFDGGASSASIRSSPALTCSAEGIHVPGPAARSALNGLTKVVHDLLAAGGSVSQADPITKEGS
jgi:hypothetical protein